MRLEPSFDHLFATYSHTSYRQIGKFLTNSDCQSSYLPKFGSDLYRFIRSTMIKLKIDWDQPKNLNFSQVAEELLWFFTILLLENLWGFGWKRMELYLKHLLKPGWPTLTKQFHIGIRDMYANLVNFVFVWRCPYPRIRWWRFECSRTFA